MTFSQDQLTEKKNGNLNNLTWTKNVEVTWDQL